MDRSDGATTIVFLPNDVVDHGVLEVLQRVARAVGPTAPSWHRGCRCPSALQVSTCRVEKSSSPSCGA